MPNQKAREHVAGCVKKAFREMDKDGSGKVNMIEFRDFCKQIPGMEGLGEAFCEIDSSDDLCISLEELNDLCTNKIPQGKIEACHVTDLFKELDKSGDGKLDKSEFKALLVSCGYSDTCIENTIAHVAGDDGMVTLQEFLQHWENDS